MTNRVFGLIWSLVFGIFALSRWLQGEPFYLQMAGLAALLAVIALAMPKLLTWPNRSWSRFGNFMHAMISDIALLLIYFAFITPAASILRMCGRNELKLKSEPMAKSYWNIRSSEKVDFTRPY